MRNLILVYAVVLFAILPAQSATLPSTADTQILGVFTNIDKKTNHIIKLIISCKNGKYWIETHIKCKGKICKWGKVPLKKTGKATYEAVYKQGLSQKKLKITQQNKQLVVTTNRTYKDSRPPSRKKDTFKLLKALKC